MESGGSHVADEYTKWATIVFDHTNDGIMVTDSKATIVSVNPSFSKVTGYQPEEVIGEKPSILKSGIHQGPFYRDLWHSISKKGSWQGEIWNRRKNGEIYNEWLTIQTVKNAEGKITNFVGVFTDITEREKIRKDMLQTATIQRKLLPKPFSDEKLTVKTFFKPKRYVSGDFYDFQWNATKDKFSGYIIDFMGHGLATAIQTSAVRVLFHQVIDENLPLNKKVEWINNEIVNYLSEDSFVAAIWFQFDFNRNEVTFCSAGINYMALYNKDKMKLEQVAGPFLGIFKNEKYEQHVLPFQAGDQLFFMSDGLLDLLDDSNNQLWKCPINDVVRFFAEITGDSPKDDASAICMSINHSAETV